MELSDPRCGAPVNPQAAGAYGLVTDYDGKTYFFCCPECQQLFSENPEHYLSRAIEPAQYQKLQLQVARAILTDHAQDEQSFAA